MEIVGLKQTVDDDVNKRIAKFVGYQSKTAKIIEEERRNYVQWRDRYYFQIYLNKHMAWGFSEWLRPTNRRVFLDLVNNSPMIWRSGVKIEKMRLTTRIYEMI